MFSRSSSTTVSVVALATCLGALSSVGAVYTPTEALVQGTANPCTDSTGATWGFYKATISTGARTPLTGPYTRASGLKGFASNGGAPYLAVNDTSSPRADSTATNNSSDADPRAIQPGELLMNVLEDQNTGKAVLRFTPPRPGLFDVSATFRAVNYANGAVDVRVMRNGGPNGEVLLNENIIRANGVASAPVVYTGRLFLTSRESLDFVVGFGADNIMYDGTGLMVEIRDAEAEGVTDAFDAGAVLAAAATSATPANPWTTAGGDWSWRTAVWNETERPELHGLLPTGYIRTTGSGFVGMGVRGEMPYVAVNTNVAYVVDGSNLGIAPGELFIHPGAYTNSLIRFAPSQPGRYRVLYTLRDLSLGISEHRADTVGVRLITHVSGEKIDDAYVSREDDINDVFGCVRLPPLQAGENVEFCIHSNMRSGWGEANNCDATGLRLVVQRLADDALPPVHDFGADFAVEEAKASPANPFTSAAGAVWEVGKASSRTGAFTRMTSVRDREVGLLRGWCTSAGSTLPAICANISGGSVEGGGAVQAGRCLYLREYWFHPGASEYGLVRFAVPSTGVYRARACIRDVNKNGDVTPENLGVHGVDCHIQMDGLTVASGYASLEAGLGADLDEDRLYLEKDAYITFAIGPNGGYADDATAARAYVMPVGGASDEQILSIDLKGSAGGTAYAGRGRIGWTNAYWNAVVAGRPSRALRLTETTRVAACIAVTNDAQTISSATGSTPNVLVGDGAASTGPEDVCTFTVTGLAPSADYELYLYGTKGRFEIGDARAVPARQTFTPFVKDVAVMKVTTDAAGSVTGTFRAETDGVTAVFGGLQIVGATFPAYVPTGTLVVIR